MKIARNSCGKEYQCRHDWAEDTFVQCGGSEERGFFFESFPRESNTFIRSDSKISLEDAESKAWEKLQKYSRCDLDHSDARNFDKRSYRNGVGFCIRCGFYCSNIFPPSEICCKCGINTYHAADKNNSWWCENCWKNVPEELLTDFQKISRKMIEEIEEKQSTDEDKEGK